MEARLITPLIPFIDHTYTIPFSKNLFIFVYTNFKYDNNFQR